MRPVWDSNEMRSLLACLQPFRFNGSNSKINRPLRAKTLVPLTAMSIRLLILLCSLPLAAGCQPATDPVELLEESGPPEVASQPEIASQKEEAAPVDLATWRSELIELPPAFAPGMPAGREILLFAPGWSDPDAEDFWSYVFLMEIEETSVGVERLDEIFELYFDGLIGAVGGSKSFELPADPAKVSFHDKGGSKYSGVVDTYDAFGSGDALTLYMLVDIERMNSGMSNLRIMASPQEPGMSVVWSSMEQVLGSLSFE